MVPGLPAILSSIDKQVQKGGPIGPLLEVLDAAKPTVFGCLRKRFADPIICKALTIKLLNLCLGKYHFRSRSAMVLSRPFGLIADPSNSCNLACPGCVHSDHAKELKVFDWRPGLLPEDRMTGFFHTYGPCAIHTTFCNYGDPLVNPQTPRFVRAAKTYLMRTMISTNLSFTRFDAEAYVESGLDSMVVSIDGATQGIYEKFRKKGNLAVVQENVRKLVSARQRLGKRTPILTWHYLGFQHNAHEIPAAIDMARDLGFDQFKVLEPYDVSWDDSGVKPAGVEPIQLDFDSDRGAALIKNWNPFPGTLAAEAIEREFELRWDDKAAGDRDRKNQAGKPSLAPTCHWLYKSITMDAGGRIFPCCASPRPDADLVFAQLNGNASADAFNSAKHQVSRMFFSDPEAYQAVRKAHGLEGDPYCINCEWNKTSANADSEDIVYYFQTAGGGLLDGDSLKRVACW